MAHAGSTYAPRAESAGTSEYTSAHAGSPYSAPRASTTPPQGNSTALYHGRKPRGCAGGARARRRKASSSKGKRPAQPGIYGPKDFSAWGWPQDPRYRRPGAWQNVELPLSPALLEQCVLIVADSLEDLGCASEAPPDVLEVSQVGVLCTPTGTEAMWWVDLLRCGELGWQLPGWETQGARVKTIEQCNAGVSRVCLVSGRSSKIGHRLPMGGGGRGFGSVAWGTSRTCQMNPLLVEAADAEVPFVMEQQVAVWSLFPKAFAATVLCNRAKGFVLLQAFAALVSSNHAEGLLLADGHATFGQSPIARHGVSHMHITSKGKRLDTTNLGFSCTPHIDTDRDIGATERSSQFSLGVWWPIGVDGPGVGVSAWPICPTFGYLGGVVGLSRPVACAFNSSLGHCSSTAMLPGGCDVIGTSTEISTREVQYRRKHPVHSVHAPDSQRV